MFLQPFAGWWTHPHKYYLNNQSSQNIVGKHIVNQTTMELWISNQQNTSDSEGLDQA